MIYGWAITVFPSERVSSSKLMNFVNTCKVISTRYEYSAFTSSSDSQVALEEVYFAQSHLVTDICLMLNC